MIKIKEITKLKKLYKVTLTESFSYKEWEEARDKIYVCEDTIVKYMLTRDKVLPTDELEQLLVFDNFAQGKSLALYFISFKARTSSEVKKYLSDHNIQSPQVEDIIDNLTKNGLLNDQAYIESYIQGKVRTASAGPYQIKQKLHLKGLDLQLIDEGITQFFNEEKQIDVAVTLAEKIVRQKASRLTLQQLKQKVTQGLTAKGFSYTTSTIALESLELEADEENELELLYTELDKSARKYSRKYEGYELKQRITQALARKGFDFSDISSAIRDYDFEEE
ncbi:recombination regulator RecX [Lactococcus formosensis]|uniref:Regulatory protein RecX n=1 Tax=Lactococcus formosensis TaxID=1281486 RepID=A0A9X4SJK9_9LACT|nr:recombination regulator RecX [Lactococcus formosensis]MDG6133367.1 recombination regulator RecX [Lactococcus formosensis]MDG6135364.1 recombination regulator RecX [Lactococcus formosensis]MDG6141470.1 recombination regulator RecX [Lactococcus formosensis]MDG6145720.1 recombination regulator RecX [Lactococcus formosensis]MDG6148250.1 recombination regulator RecX [Lactococcus formosensis]